MIRDAEFWKEVRSRDGGDPLFKTFLALLHSRQARLAVTTTTAEIENDQLVRLGEERRDCAYGRVLTNEQKRRYDEQHEEKRRRFSSYYDSATPQNTLKLDDAPRRHVSSLTIQVLQRVMLYAVPIYSLRYKIFAMSLGKSTSCFVDREEKRLRTFGASEGVNITERIKCRGCAAGDNFFSVITDTDQVWASGDLNINSTNKTVGRLGKSTKMYGVAAKALMLVSNAERLACVTRDFKVQLLSAAKQHGYPLIPSRHVRFIALGRPSDVYMVGTDSILYKVTRSEESMNTPRRVLAFARIPVSRVACGVGFILVIDQCGRLLSFGRNRFGQLGNGDRQDFHRKVFRIRHLCHRFFVQVAAGDVHSLALTSSGIVYGTGSNTEGQLGLGPKVPEVRSFTQIPLPCKCLGIAAGPSASAFALEDGSVYVAGANEDGRLGVVDAELPNESSKNLFLPTRIPSIVHGIESYTLDFSGLSFSKFGRSRPSGDPAPNRTTPEDSESELDASEEEDGTSRSTTPTSSSGSHRLHEPVPDEDLLQREGKVKKDGCACCLVM